MSDEWQTVYSRACDDVNPVRPRPHPRLLQILQKFDELDSLDAELCDITQTALKILMDPRIHEGVVQSGSTVECGVLARWFREGKSSVEIDMMYCGAIMTLDMLENNFREIPGKPGFLKILYDKSLLELFVPELHSDIREMQSKTASPYLCSHILKQELTLERVRYKDRHQILRTIVALFFKIPFSSVDIKHNEDVDGPSANINIYVTSPSGHVLDFSSDNVAALFCDFWPPIANEWLSRDRSFPSDEVISHIAKKGCHVVPKSSFGGDDKFEWRWSFSLAEIELAKARTSEQNHIYLIFKSIFYAHLKFERGGKNLPSYLVKTVMFWLSEKLPPSDWTSEHTEARLQDLINELERCIATRDLPHYFVRNINLLADIPEALLRESHEILLDIKSNPLGYLPTDVEEVGNLAGYLISCLNNIKDVLGEVSWQIITQLSNLAKLRGTLSPQASREPPLD